MQSTVKTTQRPAAAVRFPALFHNINTGAVILVTAYGPPTSGRTMLGTCVGFISIAPRAAAPTMPGTYTAASAPPGYSKFQPTATLGEYRHNWDQDAHELCDNDLVVSLTNAED